VLLLHDVDIFEFSSTFLFDIPEQYTLSDPLNAKVRTFTEMATEHDTITAHNISKKMQTFAPDAILDSSSTDDNSELDAGKWLSDILNWAVEDSDDPDLAFGLLCYI